MFPQCNAVRRSQIRNPIKKRQKSTGRLRNDYKKIHTYKVWLFSVLSLVCSICIHLWIQNLVLKQYSLFFYGISFYSRSLSDLYKEPYGGSKRRYSLYYISPKRQPFHLMARQRDSSVIMVPLEKQAF